MYNSNWYLVIGRQDFKVIKDHLVTFSPSMTLDTVSIHIFFDGDFEKDEHFNATLSAKILNLELNQEWIK